MHFFFPVFFLLVIQKRQITFKNDIFWKKATSSSFSFFSFFFLIWVVSPKTPSFKDYLHYHLFFLYWQRSFFRGNKSFCLFSGEKKSLFCFFKSLQRISKWHVTRIQRGLLKSVKKKDKGLCYFFCEQKSRFLCQRKKICFPFFVVFIFQPSVSSCVYLMKTKDLPTSNSFFSY